jgi:death-on-curing protein
LSVGLFLILNGYRLTVGQAAATIAILEVAAGELDEAAFAAWIRTNSKAR